MAWYVVATFGGYTKEIGRYTDLEDARYYATQAGELLSRGFSPEGAIIRVEDAGQTRFTEEHYYGGFVSHAQYNFTEEGEPNG